jgi:hypothetical protein
VEAVAVIVRQRAQARNNDSDSVDRRGRSLGVAAIAAFRSADPTSRDRDWTARCKPPLFEVDAADPNTPGPEGRRIEASLMG